MPAQPVPIERMLARSQNGKTLGGRDIEVHDIGGMELPDAPEPPEDLGPRGSVEWTKIWGAGFWLRPDQDYAWVEQIAHAYDDLQTYRDVVRAEGLTVDGYAGQTVAHPLIAETRKCEDTIRRCLSALGFSPSDRARLKLTELKASKTAQELLNGDTQADTRNRQSKAVQGYVEGSW